MKWLIKLILLGLSLNGCSQAANNGVAIGTKDSLYSATLQENRKIWVYVPVENSIYNKEHYPVVYLLDGETHFTSVAGMIQYLSEFYDNTVCPKIIVVGIINTDSTDDLTPTKISTSYYGNFKTSGGSRMFTTFLEKELIPYINARYPAAPYRILIGHSLAGLFTVNTLINHPDMFNAYVAIDPSLWWDHQKILKEAEGVMDKKNALANKSLYFAVANTAGADADTAEIIKDTSEAVSHMHANLLFSHFLDTKRKSGLNEAWKYYGSDNHGSVPLIAEYDALHFLFDYFQLPKGNLELMNATLFADHYKVISEKLGYRVFPPEALINNQGYIWLQRKIFDKAYAYFKLNIESYPDGFNVCDSMAD